MKFSLLSTHQSVRFAAGVDLEKILMVVDVLSLSAPNLYMFFVNIAFSHLSNLNLFPDVIYSFILNKKKKRNGVLFYFNLSDVFVKFLCVWFLWLKKFLPAYFHDVLMTVQQRQTFPLIGQLGLPWKFDKVDQICY